MDVQALSGPARYLADLSDPRAANVTYRLFDLLVIVLFAVLCRAEDFEEIADWAEQRAMTAITTDLAELGEGRLTAIDGRMLCGSLDQAGRLSPIHMVQSWDQATGLVLGQLAVDRESSEITAAAALLELLDLRGVAVSLDAMHCQKRTAEAFVENQADSRLPVKDNQPTLRDNFKLFFDEAIDQQ